MLYLTLLLSLFSFLLINSFIPNPYKKKTIGFFLFSLLLVSCAVTPTYFSKNAKQDGQTAPPDMVFIQGEGEMESFYISATEEPNINYVIYLKWLDEVFGESYPEVVRGAMPKKYDNEFAEGINDPYLQSYLTHPAFAYYPVTNLTWEQIQNYLAWKTDRLNEEILIKKGFLNSNSNQKDEDNFNTDAYLCGQYEGSVRKNIRDENSPIGERSVIFKDGILFTGFRLPTESEWEYANQSRFRSSKKEQYRGLKFPNHSFGKNHYHIKQDRLWTYNYEANNTVDDNNPPTYYKYKLRTYHFRSIKNYNVDAKEYESRTVPQLDKTLYSYDNIPADYGVINMEGGVKEWVIDKYEPRYSPENNWKTAYKKAGFSVGLEVGEQLDPDPNSYVYAEKDSLGRMKGFRFMGVNSEGLPYEVGYNYSDKKNYPRVIKGGTAQKSGNFRATMQQNQFAEDVGFRCVLPYTGLPSRGKKVKWK